MPNTIKYNPTIPIRLQETFQGDQIEKEVHQLIKKNINNPRCSNFQTQKLILIINYCLHKKHIPEMVTTRAIAIIIMYLVIEKQYPDKDTTAQLKHKITATLTKDHRVSNSLESKQERKMKVSSIHMIDLKRQNAREGLIRIQNLSCIKAKNIMTMKALLLK